MQPANGKNLNEHSIYKTIWQVCMLSYHTFILKQFVDHKMIFSNLEPMKTRKIPFSTMVNNVCCTTADTLKDLTSAM